MPRVKTIIKSILPPPVLKAIQKYRREKNLAEYQNLSTQQVFTKIYESGAWGRPDDRSQKYYSGSGSHSSAVISTYIDAICKFLSSLEKKPDVADLGCGDFFVGSKIRTLCDKYTACDIVHSLIDFNIKKYGSIDVDFRVLDITTDQLPKADIAFIRQVLQHLSNDQIASALSELSKKYKYLVVTEHMPIGEEFTHNLDKQPGPDIRITHNSGIVLTSHPFNLKIKEQKCLCDVYEGGGVIKTTLYRL